jgi:hypothetical protein
MRRWFTEVGCEPPEAVMTDNAFVNTSSYRFAAIQDAWKPAHQATSLHAAPGTEMSLS